MQSERWHESRCCRIVRGHFVSFLAAACLAPLTAPSVAVTNNLDITATAESPGPNATLFVNPYYSCTTNRYVATTGRDSANGSISTPWLTLAHANSTIPKAGTCINVEPGTYAAGVEVTHGGNLASSTGYVVYRCTTLDGCTITDPGLQGNTYGGNSAVFVAANYVMFDGFVFFSSAPQQKEYATAFSTCKDCTGSTYVTGFNHIWLLNSIITGYGLSGVAGIDFDYYYIIHNQVYQNAINPSCNGNIRGSGIALNSPITIAGYTPTADDGNNPVTGNTGTLFRLFLMWNTVYTNHVENCANETDGNGIILDTFNWNCGQGNTGCVSGARPYTAGTLVAFNIAYNNGGYGLHTFASEYVTMANNTVYNNFLDTAERATYAASLDDNGSYGNTYINNVGYVPCNGTGHILNQLVVSPAGTQNDSTRKGFSTTLGAAITATSQTKLTLASNANMPGGANAWSSNGWYGNGDYRLPGGNMVQIDSEIMQVTAGWGTMSLTVRRAFGGTTAATHSKGATVRWVPTYWSNNVIQGAAGCNKGDGSTITFYNSVWLSTNKAGTNPNWVNVGKTSTGSENVAPDGANFALRSDSPAIGYGQTPSWLSSQAADAGACYHSLSTCPWHQ